MVSCALLIIIVIFASEGIIRINHVFLDINTSIFNVSILWNKSSYKQHITNLTVNIYLLLHMYMRLAKGWTVPESNPGEGVIFRTCPDRPGAHPAYCTMDTGSFPGVNSGRGLTLTPQPLLVP
jgi:hypothetical protein